MAVSQVEERILGRLAKQTGPSNALLSASLYQVLGLSILLSRKLVKARRLRKLDTSRDTKSLQLYHHIIWLAREGLSITEVYILPYCQDGEQGPECRVMAAKLRASFYHVFCLFHNNPPVSQLSARSYESGSSPPSVVSPKGNEEQARKSPRRSPKGKEKASGSRRSGKAPLRDPIPSMTSDASYITNPYATGQGPSPSPVGPLPPLPSETRRTPTRPPGLAPVNIAESQAAAAFLLPPLNFVPLAREHFDTAQHLANSLLSPAHALRLSISLEYAGFLDECSKEGERARRLARRTIREVYASSEGLDDEEFADASALVQALGGIVRHGTNETTPRPSKEQLNSPNQRVSRAPPIDRTIAVSPAYKRNRTDSPGQTRSMMRTPERLSTVPEVESNEAIEGQAAVAFNPPVSRLSSRSLHSTASEKASKRRAVERAEELHRQRSASNRSNPSAGSHSRQSTPQELEGLSNRTHLQALNVTDPHHGEHQHISSQAKPRSRGEERRDAILKALDILSSVSKGLYTPEDHRGDASKQWRLF